VSPRNKAGFIFFFTVLGGFYGLSPAQAQNPVLGFYQEYISPLDGNRCPMQPSCSAYAGEALEKHGLFMGWIMACDRLVRCGRDETKRSPVIILDSREYIYDPVDANDFWWFEKKK
jgi:hypothetical protein